MSMQASLADRAASVELVNRAGLVKDARANRSRDSQGAEGRHETLDSPSQTNKICAGPPLPDGHGSDCFVVV